MILNRIREDPSVLGRLLKSDSFFLLVDFRGETLVSIEIASLGGPGASEDFSPATGEGCMQSKTRRERRGLMAECGLGAEERVRERKRRP